MQAYTADRLPHVESKAVMRVSAATIVRLIGNLEPRMVARDTYRRRRTARKDAGQEASISDGTLRREVTVLRAALSWAVRERWITDAPYVEMPPRPPPRDRWLTRADVDRLIYSAQSPHIRLFIILAFHTAARASAILELTWDRVDFERRLIHYDRPGRRATKKRRAVVPINAVALAELHAQRIAAVSEHVIEFRGKPVLSIKTGFAAARRRAGIEDCSPHTLRHSAATHMVMARVPMVDIARMLGDTVAMVEQVYGHHSPDFLRSAAGALAGSLLRNLPIQDGRKN